jgi:hypothetical protein
MNLLSRVEEKVNPENPNATFTEEVPVLTAAYDLLGDVLTAHSLLLTCRESNREVHYLLPDRLPLWWAHTRAIVYLPFNKKFDRVEFDQMTRNGVMGLGLKKFEELLFSTEDPTARIQNGLGLPQNVFYKPETSFDDMREIITTVSRQMAEREAAEDDDDEDDATS